MRAARVVVGLAIGASASAASGQFYLVTDSGLDVVMAVRASDGAVVNRSFLDVAGAAAAAGSTANPFPIEAIEVGNEIYVSDQNSDGIFRFDKFTGASLGPLVPLGQLEAPRGMEVIGTTLYVATSGDGLFAAGVTTIDLTTGTVTGSFSDGSDPADRNFYDVFGYNGELFVTDIDGGNDAIERYDASGAFLGTFASSDGETSFDFAQQMNARGSNGNLLVGGFSLPSGVYEYAPDGTFIGITAGDGFGPRGVAELADGTLLYSAGTTFRTDAGVLLDDGGSFRFITPASVPAPGGLALLGLGALAGAGRRRG